MREELGGKSEQAQEAAQSAGTLARELEELRQKEAMETATAAEAKALLSALAAAAQEVLDRDETVRQELRELDSRLEGGAPPSVRPGRPWPRRWRSGTRCRTSSAATPCAWSHAGRRRSRPGSAI